MFHTVDFTHINKHRKRERESNRNEPKKQNWKKKKTRIESAGTDLKESQKPLRLRKAVFQIINIIYINK